MSEYSPRYHDQAFKPRHGDGMAPQPAPELAWGTTHAYEGDGSDWAYYTPGYTYTKVPIPDFPYDAGVDAWDHQLAPGGEGAGLYGYGETPKQASRTANLNGNESTSNGSSTDSADESNESFRIKGQMLMIELELSAWMALEEVAGKFMETTVEDNIALAQRYLKCPSQSTLSAALALHEISYAVAETGPGEALEQLIEAEKAVRYVVVCRCQLATEFGDRDLFMNELKKVFDYPRLDSNARSKLMHAHRTIFGAWQGVFKPLVRRERKGRQQR